MGLNSLMVNNGNSLIVYDENFVLQNKFYEKKKRMEKLWGEDEFAPIVKKRKKKNRKESKTKKTKYKIKRLEVRVCFPLYI